MLQANGEFNVRKNKLCVRFLKGVSVVKVIFEKLLCNINLFYI